MGIHLLGTAPRLGLRVCSRMALALGAGVCFVAGLALSGCSGGGGGDETTGAAYTMPAACYTTSFNASTATSANGGAIDTSHTAEGYVTVAATNANRLKFQVSMGQMSYNYDLPGDGTPTSFPLQMGNGQYVLRIMQNTSENNYVEICAATVNVELESEFAPFLRPSIYCNFSDTSACVTQARELASSAENEGDVVRAIYNWIVANISYDEEKASSLVDATGYIPDPDSTLNDGEGICFDYASLAAAMLRSLGIPCKIVTGYVSPGDIYHAWNMIYIDGGWKSASIQVEANTWTLVDTTFAAGGASEYVGDGSSYTERYTY